jgi:hypothetical protein
LIRGMHFKVVVGEDILDIIEEFEGENDQSDDEYEVETPAAPASAATTPAPARMNTAGPDGLSRKSSKPIPNSHSAIKSIPAQAKQQQEDLDDQSLEGEFAATPDPLADNVGLSLGGGARSFKKAYTMLPLRSSSRVVTHRLGEVTLDHIKLDRTWLFDDAENLPVHKVAKKPIYSQPFFQVLLSLPPLLLID